MQLERYRLPFAIALSLLALILLDTLTQILEKCGIRNRKGQRWMGAILIVSGILLLTL